MHSSKIGRRPVSLDFRPVSASFVCRSNVRSKYYRKPGRMIKPGSNGSEVIAKRFHSHRGFSPVIANRH
jgi:hypothetical protein